MASAYRAINKKSGLVLATRRGSGASMVFGNVRQQIRDRSSSERRDASFYASTLRNVQVRRASWAPWGSAGPGVMGVSFRHLGRPPSHKPYKHYPKTAASPRSPAAGELRRRRRLMSRARALNAFQVVRGDSARSECSVRESWLRVSRESWLRVWWVGLRPFFVRTLVFPRCAMALRTVRHNIAGIVKKSVLYYRTLFR